jgi:hypothetical protein
MTSIYPKVLTVGKGEVPPSSVPLKSARKSLHPALVKFVSGGWDYFNNGGSLIIPAPQFVSGGWDNCLMKRLSATIVLLMLFSLSSTVPAKAIFGLSKCEKVKSQISTLENKMSKYLNNVRGNDYTNNIRGYDQEIFILTDAGVRNIDLLNKLDPIPTIWKVAYNNPKCFSNTQKLRIKDLKNLTTASVASHETVQKYTYSKYCDGAGSWVLPDKKKLAECFISDVKVIQNYLEYKSIYSY